MFLGIILRVLRLEISVYNVCITNQYNHTFIQPSPFAKACLRKKHGVWDPMPEWTLSPWQGLRIWPQVFSLTVGDCVTAIICWLRQAWDSQADEQKRPSISSEESVR
jgi:hypothetical protein